jgi:RND family efflux transporter MFP subunit
MIEKRIKSDAWTALGLALGMLAAACGPSSQASEVDEGEAGFVKVVNVEVETVTPTSFTSYIRLTGEIEALNDVTVSAEETGVVERFYIEKGQYVRAGAPILKIRDRVLASLVDEAEASAQLARERFERQRQLWEEEEIGSEIAYLEAKYQVQIMTARVANLKARLERTVVVAPISGIFDERYVDAGEMVAPGTRVARVVEIDRLKVTGGVAERFAASVGVGATARVTLDVLPGEETLGVIGYVGSAVDERNRTFPIEIVIENPGRVIKPQMVANVEIANINLENAYVVPQSAILRTEDGYQVFVVVEQDGRLLADLRPVQPGPSYANRTVIEEGLVEGYRLIVRGQQLVEAGDRVRVVNSELERVEG